MSPWDVLGWLLVAIVGIWLLLKLLIILVDMTEGMSRARRLKRLHRTLNEAKRRRYRGGQQ